MEGVGKYAPPPRARTDAADLLDIATVVLLIPCSQPAEETLGVARPVFVELRRSFQDHIRSKHLHGTWIAFNTTTIAKKDSGVGI